MSKKIINKKADNILIGKITAAHGIKGQVKITSFAQNPADIAEYPNIFDKKQNSFPITSISSPQGKKQDVFIVKIAGTDNRNDAEDLIGTELFIERGQLPEAEDNEFYYVDLIGLKVIDAERKEIGKVINVHDFGAGGIIEVEFNDKQNENEKKTKTSQSEFFPFNDSFVPEVNLEKGFLQLDISQIVILETDQKH